MAMPVILLIFSTSLFLCWERLSPGRELPRVSGWYLRAISMNLIQLACTLVVGNWWTQIFGAGSLFKAASWELPIAEGFAAWLVGTFVFYWWHRLRHRHGFWQIFHQVHHSPARIEVLTSFYKHPLEILVNTIISALVLFPLLGCSVMAAAWYNLFAATGEYFYHANVRTPRWLRYLVQTPELHSIHHQYDVHTFNFADIPIWDRIFGTYRDATDFTARCGFPDGAEQRLGDMLAFKDVYERDYA
jgi:sterol desaturase/sphingolipid hydroxylase (fatty acid hydroxylase superfamily)